MKTFSTRPLFQSTLRSQSRESFLADPIHSFSCCFHVFCCLLQLPRALGLSLQPLGISVKFLCAFSFTLLLFPTFPFPLGARKSSSFGSKRTIFGNGDSFVDSWKGGASQGVGIELVPALPSPLCSSDKMRLGGSAEDSPWG